eukprot:Rmarinus@m.1912
MNHEIQHRYPHSPSKFGSNLRKNVYSVRGRKTYGDYLLKDPETILQPIPLGQYRPVSPSSNTPSRPTTPHMSSPSPWPVGLSSQLSDENFDTFRQDALAQARPVSAPVFMYAESPTKKDRAVRRYFFPEVQGVDAEVGRSERNPFLKHYDVALPPDEGDCLNTNRRSDFLTRYYMDFSATSQEHYRDNIYSTPLEALELDQLQKWVSSLRPRTKLDCVPLFSLCQSFLDGLLTDRLKLKKRMMQETIDENNALKGDNADCRRRLQNMAEELASTQESLVLAVERGDKLEQDLNELKATLDNTVKEKTADLLKALESERTRAAKKIAEMEEITRKAKEDARNKHEIGQTRLSELKKSMHEGLTLRIENAFGNGKGPITPKESEKEVMSLYRKALAFVEKCTSCDDAYVMEITRGRRGRQMKYMCSIQRRVDGQVLSKKKAVSWQAVDSEQMLHLEDKGEGPAGAQIIVGGEDLPLKGDVAFFPISVKCGEASKVIALLGVDCVESCASLPAADIKVLETVASEIGNMHQKIQSNALYAKWHKAYGLVTKACSKSKRVEVLQSVFRRAVAKTIVLRRAFTIVNSLSLIGATEDDQDQELLPPRAAGPFERELGVGEDVDVVTAIGTDAYLPQVMLELPDEEPADDSLTEELQLVRKMRRGVIKLQMISKKLGAVGGPVVEAWACQSDPLPPVHVQRTIRALLVLLEELPQDVFAASWKTIRHLVLLTPKAVRFGDKIPFQTESLFAKMESFDPTTQSECEASKKYARVEKALSGVTYRDVKGIGDTLLLFYLYIRISMQARDAYIEFRRIKEVAT